MIEQDTIKLLRECDAGVKMGIASINDVLTHVESEAFQKQLSGCKQEHEKLQDEIQQELDRKVIGQQELTQHQCCQTEANHNPQV